MADTVSSDSVAQDQLRAFIERIERMEEEKKAIADDIREIYLEAKGNGFSVPVLREIVKIRKQDHVERLEREALLDLYMAALGMQAEPRFGFDDDDPPPRGSRSVGDHRPAALEMPRQQAVGSEPQAKPSEGKAGTTARSAVPPDGDASRTSRGVDTPATHSDSVSNPDAILRSGREEASRLAHNQEIVGSSPAPATSSPETAIQSDPAENRAENASGEASDPSLQDNSNTPGGSGTAREASGGSAPSNGIADLKEGLEAAPRTIPEAPKPLPVDPGIEPGMSITQEQRPAEAKTSAQELLSSGSGEVQDECMIHLPANSPETAHDTPDGGSSATDPDSGLCNSLGAEVAPQSHAAPETDKPGEASASPAPAGVSMQRHNTDPRCLDKAKCGAFTNFAWCNPCRIAAGFPQAKAKARATVDA